MESNFMAFSVGQFGIENFSQVQFARLIEDSIAKSRVYQYPPLIDTTKTNIRKALFCYDCFNNMQLSPEGEVNSGGYIPRREASRYISTALHRP